MTKRDWTMHWTDVNDFESNTQHKIYMDKSITMNDRLKQLNKKWKKKRKKNNEKYKMIYTVMASSKKKIISNASNNSFEFHMQRLITCAFTKQCSENWCESDWRQAHTEDGIWNTKKMSTHDVKPQINPSNPPISFIELSHINWKWFRIHQSIDSEWGNGFAGPSSKSNKLKMCRLS